MSLIVLDSTGLQPETREWLSVLTTPPSAQVTKAVNTFIRESKSNGNWSLFDRFWLFAQDNQTNARVSIVNPTATAITEVNSPTWTSLRGYTGNGSNMYLRTGWIPNNSTIYLQNSACTGIYSRTNSLDAGADYGTNNAATSATSIHYTKHTSGNGLLYSNTNAAGVLQSAVTDSSGFWAMHRASSTRVDGYYNGVSQFNNSASTSTGRSTVEMYVLARNDNGSLTAPCSRQISLFYSGSSSLNMLSLNSTIQKLATDLGFNV